MTHSVSQSKLGQNENYYTQSQGFFDPLGLISPFVIRGKMIVQDLWKQGLKWDGLLEDSLQRQVMQWWGEAHDQVLENLFYHRYIGPTVSPVTIHMSSDASFYFGCSTYAVRDVLRVFFLYAKSKVAPVKSV